jgi:hypothetical protein
MGQLDSGDCKLWVSWIQVVTAPHLAEHQQLARVEHGRRVGWVRREVRQVRKHRDVADKLLTHSKVAKFETGFSLYRFKG